MEPNQTNTTPVSPTATSGKPSIGAFVGIIVIVLVVIFGAFYFWGKMLDEKAMTGTMEDTPTQMLNTQSSSDEIGSIEADLNSTDVNNLAKELGDIDASLKEAGI